MFLLSPTIPCVIYIMSYHLLWCHVVWIMMSYHLLWCHGVWIMMSYHQLWCHGVWIMMSYHQSWCHGVQIMMSYHQLWCHYTSCDVITWSLWYYTYCDVIAHWFCCHIIYYSIKLAIFPSFAHVITGPKPCVNIVMALVIARFYLCAIHTGSSKQTLKWGFGLFAKVLYWNYWCEGLNRITASNIQVTLSEIRQIDIAANLGCRPFLEMDSCQCYDNVNK
jgi:hypothetical protein